MLGGLFPGPQVFFNLVCVGRFSCSASYLTVALRPRRCISKTLQCIIAYLFVLYGIRIVDRSWILYNFGCFCSFLFVFLLPSCLSPLFFRICPSREGERRLQVSAHQSWPFCPSVRRSITPVAPWSPRSSLVFLHDVFFCALNVGGAVAQEESKTNCHQCWTDAWIGEPLPLKERTDSSLKKEES